LQNAANYWYWLEFGSRYMAPRSFLRLALIENEEKAWRLFAKIVKRRLNRYLK
jgi:HK97 gp10 family phage protein